MPTRVVRGEILTSKSLARVSIGAELLFRNLIALADDYGRYDGDPEIIAAHAYPRRRSITTSDVEGWLEELTTADQDGRGPVEMYSVDGRCYLRLVNWELHRGKSRRGAASRWPQPPEMSCEEEAKPSAEIHGDPRGSAGTPGDPPGESGSRGVEESGKDRRRQKKPPPPKPSARGVGVADSRANQTRTQVERALMRAPTESDDARADRRARLEVLAELFLACSRVPDEAQLRSYYRTTEGVRSGLLRAACDRALEDSENEKGFAPPPAAINAAGRKLAAEARKRARETA